jgi:hypothetical protein
MISKNTEAESSYVAYLQFKDSEKIKKELIEPKIHDFFRARSISKYIEISSNKEISDLDFDKQGMDYFYENIFYDIYKNRNGKIEIQVKYCITLDKKNCKPDPCDKTGIYYDEICLNKEPVFYFIYVSIEDIFTFLRAES